MVLRDRCLVCVVSLKKTPRSLCLCLPLCRWIVFIVHRPTDSNSGLSIWESSKAFSCSWLSSSTGEAWTRPSSLFATFFKSGSTLLIWACASLFPRRMRKMGPRITHVAVPGTCRWPWGSTAVTQLIHIFVCVNCFFVCTINIVPCVFILFLSPFLYILFVIW